MSGFHRMGTLREIIGTSPFVEVTKNIKASFCGVYCIYIYVYPLMIDPLYRIIVGPGRIHQISPRHIADFYV
jgi:hypothetical protein